MMILGDCLQEMQKMEDNCIDYIITDPPYALSFMSKKWDAHLPSIEIWKEALRICKPGAWIASFGGTRTYHRLTCNIEDAGWEIRDCIMWLYGSGFPKGKGCLKPAYEPIILARKKAPKPTLNIDECRIGTEERINNSASNIDREKWRMNNGADAKPCIGRWPANIIFDELAAQQLDLMTEEKIHLSGKSNRGNQNKSMFSGLGNSTLGKRVDYVDNNKGASRFFYCAKSSSSERNRGLEGMFWLDNLELVLHNGTSFTLEELWVQGVQSQSMNLDSEALQEKDMFEDLTKFQDDKECCIISCGNSISDQFPKTIKFTTSMGSKQTIELKTWNYYQPLSISDCIQDVLKTNRGNGSNLAENVGLKNILKRIFTKEKTESLLGVKNAVKKMSCLISVKEELKKGNIHPTLKPLSLMKYLIKLLAPPGDPLLLDPFAGSGSTLLAAKELGYRAIGVEKEPEYYEIAKKRLKYEDQQMKLQI